VYIRLYTALHLFSLYSNSGHYLCEYRPIDGMRVSFFSVGDSTLTEEEVEEVVPVKPKSHIVFESSSESGCERGGGDDDGGDGDDGDGADDNEEPDKSRRSVYVGRGNVQAVRAARKAAGLNECFPRSDPLLVEFVDFLQMSGGSEKDTANKVILLLIYHRIRYDMTSLSPESASTLSSSFLLISLCFVITKSTQNSTAADSRSKRYV